jgi:DNA-binding response OmpR family regulator
VIQSKRIPPEPPSVLVVCTSATTRHGLTALLASAGYAVTGADDAWRALRLAESQRFALAILDPLASDPAGDLLRHFRQGKCVVKVLVLADCDPARSLSGVDVVMVRPILVRDLLKAIEQLIGPPVPPETGGRKPRAA